MVFGLFTDERIEKIAAAIDKEFKNIQSILISSNENKL